MKRTLLLSLLMALTLAARAVRVTFAAPEGFEISSVIVDGDHLSGFYDEATQTLTYGADLEPGQHSVKAELSQPTDYGVNYWGMGGAQTFTVGSTPMTVTYSLDNYAQLNFTATDENGQPLPELDIQLSDAEDNSYINSGGTGADGTCILRVPADLGTFTYEASGRHYAQISQTAELSGKEMDLSVSYADYCRISLNVPEFDFTSGNQLELKLVGMGNEAPVGEVYFYENKSEGEPQTYYVVPKGEYSCRATEISSSDYSVLKVDHQRVTAGDTPVEVNFNLNNGVLLTVDYADITSYPNGLYLLPEGCTTQGAAIEFTGSVSVPAGKYMLYGSVGGETSSYYNLNRMVELTSSESIVLKRGDFRTLQFSATGLNIDWENTHMHILHGFNENFVASGSGEEQYYMGDFTYATSAGLWIDGWSYATPLGYEVRGKVAESGVTTIDMSHMRAFKVSLPDVQANFYQIEFTDANGATAQLSFLMNSMGVILPVGTYTVTTQTGAGPMQCTLEVPDDCPETLKFNFSATPTGIQSATAGKLSAQAEAGGLRIAVPQGGRVSVNVFDLSGRRVLTAQAGDGEVISTAALVPGVYVARLGAGSAAATVKFTVR